MKTLKNIFGSKNTNKTMNSFTEILDLKAMQYIKGGDGDSTNDENDDDWPPADNTDSKSN